MKLSISLPSKAVSPFWKLLQRPNISQEEHNHSSALWDSAIPFSFLFTNTGLASSLNFISCASMPSCFKLSSGTDQQVCFRETEALASQIPCTLLEAQHWLTRQDEAWSKRQRRYFPVGGHVLGMSSSSLPEILSFVSPCFPQGHKSAFNRIFCPFLLLQEITPPAGKY